MKIDMDELPTEVVGYILKLRKEAAQYRNQRNDARADSEELRIQIATLQSDIETLYQGIDPRCGAPVGLISR
jgi:phage shock protein A